MSLGLADLRVSGPLTLVSRQGRYLTSNAYITVDVPGGNQTVPIGERFAKAKTKQ